MNIETRDRIISSTLNHCLDLLGKKTLEYTDKEDMLAIFKVAGELRGESTASALAGMMAKHTVSIYSMCANSNVNNYPLAVWEEKIGDSINYLLLLMCAVVESRTEELDKTSVD